MEKEKKNENEKVKRVLSGMRPTGSLHVGHLKGVLSTWISLQNNAEHSCFFLVADIHALTTDWNNSGEIRKNSILMVSDWLASGISHEKSIIFLQSDVPEHMELFAYLGMITPLGLLERNPTYKEFLQDMGNSEMLRNLGFFSYPVLQSADILIYKAHKVPVGRDQVPHIEIARDIAEKFNKTFAPIFPLPEPILGETPKILGTDGRKMSKSYGNAIELSEDIKKIEGKVLVYMTDTARKTRKDPGEPLRCPLYTLHRVFTPPDKRAEIETECRQAGFGCIDCKKILLKYMIPEIEKFQQVRRKIKEDDTHDILLEGAKKAREFASGTIQEVKKAVFGT